MNRPSADHPDDDLRDEAVEFTPPEDSDLIYQLGEKIRLQARRLTTLEQYKLLCEKRILELCPNHALPVKQEHLGKESIDSRHLHQAQQKIARLEQQLNQGSNTNNGLTPDDLRSFISEKTALEESYRAEILHSEEQRALIEALKQALEEKSEPIALETASNYVKLQAEFESIKQENQRIRGILDQKQSNLDELRTVAETKVNEAEDLAARLSEEITKFEDLSQVCEQYKEEIRGHLEKIAQIEEEKSDLQTQLASLEDVIAKEKSAIQGLETELYAVQSEHTGLQRKHQETSSVLSEKETHSRELAKVKDKLITDNDSLRHDLSKTFKDLDSALKQVAANANLITAIQSDNAELQARVEFLTKTTDEQTGEIRALQQTLDQAKAELSSSQAQKAYFQTAYNSAKQETGEKEAAEFRAKGEIKELQKALQMLLDESAEAERRMSGREQELMRKTAGLEREKAEVEANLNKEKEAHSRTLTHSTSSLQRSESDNQQRIRQLESQYQTLSTESSERIATLQSDIEQLNSALAEASSKSKDHETQRERTYSELRSTGIILESTIKERDETARELEETKNDVKTIRAAFQTLQETNEKLENDLRNTKLALNSDQADLQELQTEHEAVLKENEGLKESLSALQTEFASLQSESTEISQELVSALKKGKEEEERGNRLEGVIRESVEGVRGLLERFAGVLEVQEVGGTATLPESLSSLSSLISITESRLSTSQEALNSLQSLLDQSTKDLHSLETLLRSRSSHESEIYLEIQTLREQLSSERATHTQQLEDMRSEYESLEQQYQRSVGELKEHRDRLREYAIENSEVQRENSQLLSSIARMEEKLSGAMSEKRRSEMLLNRFLKVAQVGAEVRRVMIDMVQTSSDLNTVERLREVVRGRIEEMESQSAGEEVQRILQTEKMSLMRSDSEATSLQQRLQSLDEELDDLTHPRYSMLPSYRPEPLSARVEPLSALSSHRAEPLSALPYRTEPVSATVRYDPRISPYLSDPMKKRLTEGKSQDRFMRTAPIVGRSQPGGN